MSKKQSELKKALQSLKVNEALRLPKGQAVKDFAFMPPEQSEIKSSPAQTDSSLPKSEMKMNSASCDPSLLESQLENSIDQNNLGVTEAKSTPISAQNVPSSNNSQLNSSSAHKELRSNRSQLQSRRDSNVPSTKSSQLDPSSDTKGSAGFDLSPFLAGHGKIELVERGEGSFHIPHRIYEYVHKAVDTKVELLVFNCLLRYTLGFQRATCKASQSFISRWTGIAVPNVRKALKSLVERRFIRRLEEGTISHDSAVYELPIVTAYLTYDRARKLGAAVAKSSELEKNSDRHDLGSSSPQIPDRIDPGSGIESISKKEIKNKERNKTLSREFPIQLQRHFDAVLPNQKRERELKAFETLEGQFTIEQIESALSFVQKHGALEDKAPVHSPMAYLALSIGDVLRLAQEEDDALKRRQEVAQRQNLERQDRQKKEDHETEEFRRKEQAFCSAFSSAKQQEEIIRKTCEREQFGWKPQGQVARSIAIQTWWDELSLQERNSLGAV